MEKIWDELKKIEAQAEQIRSDAQIKAKKMTNLAEQEAETLIANSRTYAEEEGQRICSSAIHEANHSRDEQLTVNQAVAEKLRAKAEKRMEKAVLAVVNIVLEEAKP
jgi:F0F1-type ATP synthase membrane subunit b/b'